VRNPTFVTQSDGSIRNIYDVRLRNKAGEDRAFRLGLTSDGGILRINLEGAELSRRVVVPADTTLSQRVYITARPEDPASSQTVTQLRIWVEDVNSNTRASKKTTFNGKGD